MSLSVLIPHREARKKLENLQEELFRQGLLGALSLPIFVLLNQDLIAPFQGDLSSLAREIRDRSIRHDGGWILRGDTIYQSREIPFRGSGLSLLGYDLDPGLLVCALGSAGESRLLCDSGLLKDCAFRAAWLSRMEIRPRSPAPYSYSWSLQGQVWLPNTKKPHP